MQIQNFNKPEDAGAPTPGSDTASASGLPPAAGRRPAEDAGRHDIEIALLNAQIEHLELVVETARSLMTSNQEKLLRRLHDLPREMVALSARLNGIDGGAAVRPAPGDHAQVRRVA